MSLGACVRLKPVPEQAWAPAGLREDAGEGSVDPRRKMVVSSVPELPSSLPRYVTERGSECLVVQ